MTTIPDVVFAKQSFKKWRSFVKCKRILPTKIESTGSKGLEDGRSLADINRPNDSALVNYFVKAGLSSNDTDIDFDYVAGLVSTGADIQAQGKYGLTVLHEACRIWHTDVAKFLIELGADVNDQDDYGVTPLHMAAAANYAEMVQVLFDNGADLEATTEEECQTPVHYAARTDSVDSLNMLILCGAKFHEVRDYKGRTPLQLAAELDRSGTAALLLDRGAPANVRDKSGTSAITMMIAKMPPVAKTALDQFHVKNRATRRQKYYLHYLEYFSELNQFVDDQSAPDNSNWLKTMPSCEPKSALQMAVQYSQFDILLHPVMYKVQAIMWTRFARFWSNVNFLVNIIFTLLWTVLALFPTSRLRHIYEFPRDIWRLVVAAVAMAMNIYLVVVEIREFRTSVRRHEKWKAWRTRLIELDKERCHPCWAEDKKFLDAEIENLDSVKPQYSNDFWNIWDWSCYGIILVGVGLHIWDVFDHNETLSRWHIRLACVVVIMLWLRLMKNARAYTPLGPFIVMLGKMTGDILRFLFLYAEFYIPFTCCFWMIFGGPWKIREDARDKVDGTPSVGSIYHTDGNQDFKNLNDSVEDYFLGVGGMKSPGALLFTMFRMTVVDEYDYESMELVDNIMAPVLVTSWLFISAIITLNLLIALLSDTFQRVHDNAKANAQMQKAITILNIQENLGRQRRTAFQRYLWDQCSPLIDYYDDDSTGEGESELQKVTMQIKQDVGALADDFYKFQRKQADLDELRRTLVDNDGDDFFGGGKGTGSTATMVQRCPDPDSQDENASADKTMTLADSEADGQGNGSETARIRGTRAIYLNLRRELDSIKSSVNALRTTHNNDQRELIKEIAELKALLLNFNGIADQPSARLETDDQLKTTGLQAESVHDSLRSSRLVMSFPSLAPPGQDVSLVGADVEEKRSRSKRRRRAASNRIGAATGPFGTSAGSLPPPQHTLAAPQLDISPTNDVNEGISSPNGPHRQVREDVSLVRLTSLNI